MTITCPECKNTKDIMLMMNKIAWCPCGCIFSRMTILAHSRELEDADTETLRCKNTRTIKCNAGTPVEVMFTDGIYKQ